MSLMAMAGLIWIGVISGISAAWVLYAKREERLMEDLRRLRRVNRIMQDLVMKYAPAWRVDRILRRAFEEPDEPVVVTDTRARDYQTGDPVTSNPGRVEINPPPGTLTWPEMIGRAGDLE